MNFTMPRDKIVPSTLGHCIEFKKGVPTFVPPAMYDLVMAAGGVSDEELPEAPVQTGTAPTDPMERSGLIQVALEIIATRNVATEFTSGGSPHAKVLSAELGWPVDAKERDIEWAKFQATAD